MEEPARVATLSEMPRIVAPAFADDDGEYEAYGEAGAEALKELHEPFMSVAW